MIPLFSGFSRLQERISKLIQLRYFYTIMAHRQRANKNSHMLSYLKRQYNLISTVALSLNCVQT